MKKRKLYTLMVGLESVKNLKGVRFAYARAKNKKLVLSELQLLEESMKASDKYLEYDKKRVKLCEKYCKKDEKDNPIIEGSTYVGLVENEAFNEELEKLRKKFKETIDERKKQSEEYDKILDEEIELKFHKISLKNIPTEITGQQLELIMPIIKED